MLLVPYCVVVDMCINLYQMISYLLLISYAKIVREVVSRLGCLIQVLAALNPVDQIHDCGV